jgi:hypothetical protein
MIFLVVLILQADGANGSLDVLIDEVGDLGCSYTRA